MAVYRLRIMVSGFGFVENVLALVKSWMGRWWIRFFEVCPSSRFRPSPSNPSFNLHSQSIAHRPQEGDSEKPWTDCTYRVAVVSTDREKIPHMLEKRKNGIDFYDLLKISIVGLLLLLPMISNPLSPKYSIGQDWNWSNLRVSSISHRHDPNVMSRKLRNVSIS